MSEKPNQKRDLSRLTLGKVLSVVGIILQLPIIFYFATALLGLMESSHPVFLYEAGSTQMSGEVSAALARLMSGTLLALTGLIVSLIALFTSDYRSKSLFWFSVILSVFWVLSFPIGTAFGIVYLAILVIKRPID